MKIPKKISRIAFYFVVLFGVIGLFAFSTGSQKPSKPSPIQFSDLGFPYKQPVCLVGIPQILVRSKAIPVIDSVFKANQIELQTEYHVSEGEEKFIADGYNPESKTGYIWLDEKNTDKDCYRPYYCCIYDEEDLLEEDLPAYFEILKGKEAAIAKKGNQPHMYSYYVNQWELNNLYPFFEELWTKNNYYKLLKLKRNSFLKDKVIQYVEENPDYYREDYGQTILDEYDAKKLDLQEMKRIVEAEEYSVAAFSPHCFTYHFKITVKEIQIKVDPPEYKTVRKFGDKKAQEKLANFVQEYIDWAKSEGRF